jgi:Bacteriocin-protection, YdeI or OmpD-Associated/Domain of unknown function (DUF1905)
MPAIQFTAKPYSIDSWTVLHLPAEASAKLPSRGQVMVKGTINDVPFQDALEPDGNGGHWLAVGPKLMASAHVSTDDSAELSIEATKDWPEPVIPKDLQKLLNDNADLQQFWAVVTPMARWEWIRWIGSTKQAATREHRLEVAASKLRRGERRPCCFNRSMCCVPDVSKNGVLLEPASV